MTADITTRAIPGHPSSAPSGLALDKLRATPLARDPFDHVIVPGFLAAATLGNIARDFPPITDGGSHPAFTLNCGPSLRALFKELRGPAMAQAVGEKLNLDLTDKATMLTLRGQAREKDGRIHTDSKSKLVTALIYLNEGWESDAGRLRLLRQPDNLDDYVVEVPPQAGTLLVFRCTDKAWHGHKPFVGQRRSLQLNWVVSHSVARWELMRHGLSHVVGKVGQLFRRKPH